MPDGASAASAVSDFRPADGQYPLVAGIDPGLSGGLALVRGREVIRMDPMPARSGRILPREVMTWLNLFEPTAVAIEVQRVIPGQGANLKIGANYGILLACLDLYGEPYIEVTPVVWNRRAKIKSNLPRREKKAASYSVAEREFGRSFRDKAVPVSKDGLYEAALIARFGIAA